jgi:prolyl-tRNA synthetase
MKTAITPTREENFAEWYQNVIIAADLAENSPTRGSMTIKPYGWAIWELMKDELDKQIKKQGVQNCQFPLLIPIDFLSREAEHVEGFAKETAVVTHHRLKMIDGKLQPDPDSKLSEPYIIRPTSETIIGEAMSRWVQSYRDLPLQLNQWANVMRWEMRTRMFLRSSEIFWQEGHCAFATYEEAQKNAETFHKLYTKFMQDWLAIESVIGEKTPDERFAGADHTYTREHIMQDGKALQVGTSHNLGQHFSKSFNIKFLGDDGQQHFAYTTSWGTSTRMIGSLIMIHSDDDGLVLPPAVAPVQVVIIPITSEQNDYAHKVAESLGDEFRIQVDDSDARSSDKMWKWIKKGVPLRIEVGAKEMADGTITITRRDIGKDSKTTVALADADIAKRLSEVQANLLERSRALNARMIHPVAGLDELEVQLANGVPGFFKLPYVATLAPKFDELMETYKISRRCLDEYGPEMVYVAKSY